MKDGQDTNAANDSDIQGVTDSLTGLYAKSGFLEHVRQQLANIERDQRLVLLLLVRLNNLQDIYDNFGTGEGDKALKEFAGILNEAFRNSDLIGRMGENLFLVFGQQISAAGKGVLSERLQDRIAGNMAVKSKPYDFVVSMIEAKWDPQLDKEIQKFLVEMEQRLV